MFNFLRYKKGQPQKLDPNLFRYRYETKYVPQDEENLKTLFATSFEKNNVTVESLEIMKEQNSNYIYLVTRLPSTFKLHMRSLVEDAIKAYAAELENRVSKIEVPPNDVPYALQYLRTHNIEPLHLSSNNRSIYLSHNDAHEKYAIRELKQRFKQPISFTSESLNIETQQPRPYLHPNSRSTSSDTVKHPDLRKPKRKAPDHHSSESIAKS